MNKKFFITAAAVAVTVVIILTVIIVSSGKEEVAITESPKENEQETIILTLSTTTPRVVTYTELYGPTTSEPVIDKTFTTILEPLTTTLEPSSAIGAGQTNNDYLNRLMKDSGEERLKKIFSITFSCVSQSGITLDEAREIRYGFIGENSSSKEFIFCLMNKFGIVNEDGEMTKDINSLIEIWGQTGDNDKAKTVIAACRDKKAETRTDTAVLVYKCIKTMK